MNKISPMVALVIAVCILILLGGVYLVRNSQSGQDLAETSKRGQETGKMMMTGGAEAKQAMQQKMGTSANLDPPNTAQSGADAGRAMMGGPEAQKMMMDRMKANAGSH